MQSEVQGLGMCVSINKKEASGKQSMKKKSSLCADCAKNLSLLGKKRQRPEFVASRLF